MELENLRVFSEVEAVGKWYECEACALVVGEITVLYGAEGKPAGTIAGKAVGLLKGDAFIAEFDRGIWKHIPYLVRRHEVASERFIYPYTRCRAKQYRTESRSNAADSAYYIQFHYSWS